MSVKLPKLGKHHIYKGEVKNCVREGEGKFNYIDAPNTYTYEGHWTEGKKNKIGNFKITGFSTYNGEFNDGEIQGYGRRVWIDGREYTGMWKKGIFYPEPALRIFYINTL